MKERTGRLRSRYIGATFAALFLLIAGINAASVFISGRNLQSPEGIEKEVSDFAEVVIPFGMYEEVRVLDGEKGIAAVKEKDGFVKLIDFHENLLLDLERVDLIHLLHMLSFEFLLPGHCHHHPKLKKMFLIDNHHTKKLLYD